MEPTMQNAGGMEPKKSKTGLIIGVIFGLIIIVLLIVIIMGQQQKDEEPFLNIEQEAEEVKTNVNPTPSSNEVKTTNKTTTPAPAPVTPAPSIVLADYKGEWNGSYSANALAPADCARGGAANFSVNNTGGVSGYAVIENVNVPGSGTVDKNGNLSGYWRYSGLAVSFSGKLNTKTDTGSGTYQNAYGCFGSFSVKR